MNTYTMVFGVLLCLAAVDCRNFGEKNVQEGFSDGIGQLQEGSEKKSHEHNSNPRHRRRRWQNNYGYNYQQPPAPFYQEDWRNIDRNEHDLMPQIYRLLDELSAYVRRPPLPPQPIYVPYPVPYPVPQACKCPSKDNKNPNISSRFPEMEDTNQNWGFLESNDADYEEDSDDGGRPISFAPIRPIRPVKLPVPSVEHGSSQAGMDQTTRAPFAGQDRVASSRIPGICNAAILSCCSSGSRQQQRTCFNNFNCGSAYSRGNACSKQSISAALETFQTAYSPVN